MTAKELKLRKMSRQLDGILASIEGNASSTDLAAGILFKGAIFPEVVEELTELGFDVTLNDMELVPMYYISYADVDLSDQETINAFLKRALPTYNIF